MRRFFVAPERLRADEVVLDGEVHHHLCRVLRLEPGAEVVLLDGRGLVVRARIEELTKKVARVRVLARTRADENLFPVRLIQGLPKGDKMDLILQKGTELGVTAFTPLCAGRSVARLTGGRKEGRRQRWEKIVREAARQSGRTVLPEVQEPVELAQALAGDEELRLLLWEGESRPLRDALPAVRPRSAAILVGPEGGLAGGEVARARAAGFLPVSLGRRILRTETAGFAVVAILEYLYGDLGCPPQGAPPPGLPGKESP